MLSQAHRRSIHTSLTPVLGEEETDALMSEFPANESDMPATKADLVELRHEMQLGFSNMRTEMHDLFRRMTMQMLVVIASSLVGGMALSAGIAAGVAQAVGGG